MGYAYSANGLSWRSWDNPAQLADGEVYFDHVPDAAELASSFSGYAAAVAAVAAQSDFDANLKLGITITNGGASAAPTGTFALDAVTQADLQGIASTVSFTGSFPDEVATFSYPDINGAPQAFPSVDAFKAFYGAYAALLFNMRATLQMLQAGGDASWPSQAIALP